MKRLHILILLALIAAFVSIALAATGFRYHKPTAFDKDQQLIISGKSRHYFVLAGDSQVEVNVDGPSRLKVMSRIALAQGVDSAEYAVEYTLDGGNKANRFSHKAAASAKAEYADKREGYIAALRTHIIEVPRGKHTYIFRLPQDAVQTIYLRFSQETNEFTTGTPVVVMTPFEFTSSVDLVSREENYTYYRVSGKDRVVLKLVGPSTLKVLSRIEYDSDMQGKQKWKVQVLEDGGVNVYEFKLPENHRSSIFRFLMPKSQLEGK